jgi:hypothetical protein
VSSYRPYTDEKFEDEVFRENAQDLDEMVTRMDNPKMTRFRAMSLDEKTTTIDKSTQEALIEREEMIATEAVEVLLAALVQDRGFPMMQDACERGLS